MVRRLFLLDPDIVFNCFFASYNTFFMAIASTAIGIFRCYSHPDGQRSLQMAPEILCYSDTWNDVLIAGVISVLVLCLAPFVLWQYILMVASYRFEQHGFQTRWKFFFSKFQLNPGGGARSSS